VLSTRRASESGTATASARHPTSAKPVCSPEAATTASIASGAIAVPINPAKLCTEKARPSRPGAIRAERIA
jgi:hypothetical protein